MRWLKRVMRDESLQKVVIWQGRLRIRFHRDIDIPNGAACSGGRRTWMFIEENLKKMGMIDG